MRGEAKHLDRYERHQFYLASELGVAVHRATSDGGDGEPRYNITRASDQMPIATGVTFATLQAFTNGQPLPPASSLADDLTAAVAALMTGFTALDRAVHVQLAALNAALAGSSLPAASLLPMRQAAVNIAHITGSMARDATASPIS
jgi:hypothetical protein